MKNRREQGIALVTALLVLMLVSSLIVGITWLTISDQKMGYNYSGRQTDFYIAESGLEKMTADLATAFNNNYNISATTISGIQTGPAPLGPPTLPSGYTFWDPNNPGNAGYLISYTPNPSNGNNPLASYHTILTGTYAGLVGLLTPYTLEVTTESPFGSETKLKRTVQTAAIPVFQFGIFSTTDLSFFAGPDFDFGGRVHTNGNLWLAENGGTLTMENKVTAAEEVIRTNLENGTSTSGSYNTTVNITTNPGSGSYRALATTEGTTTGNSYYGNVSTSYTNNWATAISAGDYNSNLGARESGVQPLNLGIATPSLGGQSIDIIRTPVVGEDSSNNQKYNERYYAQASVRILLSDYGPSGGCSDADITKLPQPSPNPPVDLATLAWDASLASGYNTNVGDSSVNPPPYKTAPTAAPNTNQFSLFTAAVGTAVFPLPTSGAAAGTPGAYNSTNGYWVQHGYPIETGCLKIDYQSVAGGSFTDITWLVLSYGYTGANINPSYIAAGAPALPALLLPNNAANQQKPQGPTINTGVTTVSCSNPSPNAIIRLARVRDNPYNNTAAAPCGPTPFTNAVYTYGYDFWPNVLFDTREGTLRDTAPATVASYYPVTLAGTMHYIELDVKNLVPILTNPAVNNTTGYTVYFSDRRGDQADPSFPASTSGSPSNKTGGYGFEDIINPSNPTTGCPNNVLDVLGTAVPAEDVEADITNGASVSPTLRTYGNILYPPATLALPSLLWPYKGVGSELASVPALITTAATRVLTPNSLCPTPTGIPSPYTQWPYAFAAHTQDLRENPPLFFRRALKLVDGGALASASDVGIFGTCNGVNCGLTVVAENPVYIQGDYNDENLDPNFASTSPHIACAVIGDAVTFLSDNWNDVNSFIFPYGEAGAVTNGGRNATTTMYRAAIVGGKGIPFLQPSGTAADYGTDGGMHNFLRYIENWGGATLDYHGSVVSFYYNHQLTGTYKCCNTVYEPPTRGYKFDADFETPSLLPPRTPMLRAINTVGFTQVILPTQ